MKRGTVDIAALFAPVEEEPGCGEGMALFGRGVLQPIYNVSYVVGGDVRDLFVSPFRQEVAIECPLGFLLRGLFGCAGGVKELLRRLERNSFEVLLTERPLGQ